MGHKHTREQILDGALAVALDDGLHQLTFGRVAKRLGINDRTVVYYFPTKGDLVSDVLVTVGVHLQATLAEAFTGPASDHVALARAAWPVVATPEADPVFRLYFEAVGLGIAGRAPYASVVPQLTEAWIAWAEPFLSVAPDQRRSVAEAAVTLLDGLLLLRQVSGPQVAARAARTLGVA